MLQAFKHSVYYVTSLQTRCILCYKSSNTVYTMLQAFKHGVYFVASLRWIAVLWPLRMGCTDIIEERDEYLFIKWDKKLLAAERGPSGGCLAKRLYLRFVYRLRESQIGLVYTNSVSRAGFSELGQALGSPTLLPIPFVTDSFCREASPSRWRGISFYLPSPKSGFWSLAPVTGRITLPYLCVFQGSICPHQCEVCEYATQRTEWWWK